MIEIFCDFDGTITNKDSIVFLTERHGAGGAFRRDVLARIKSGEITVFEAIQLEMATVRLSWEEAVESLQREISIDPTFGGLVEWCRNQAIPLSIVSSGMRPIVSLYVGEYGVPIHAHPVQIDPRGWLYERDENADKEKILRSSQAETRIYVGDGTSDVCVIPYVDVLFAKSYLASYCREQGIGFLPFRDFGDVVDQLKRNILPQPGRGAISPADRAGGGSK